MKSVIQTFLVILAVTLTPQVNAGVSESEYQAIKKALSVLKKDVVVTKKDIKSSALPNLYEVTFGARIFYVSKDGKYLLTGELFDVKNARNLTEDAKVAVRLNIMKKIDEKDMIIFTPKDGKVKHTVTVFTDIDCPYCQKMHYEINDYLSRGIRVRYLLYPRAEVGSDTYNKAVSVWCAKDRKAAFADAKARKPIKAATCSNPVSKHMQIGQEIGVTGTPTIVQQDGRLVPGYVPAKYLIKVLEKNKDKKKISAR